MCIHIYVHMYIWYMYTNIHTGIQLYGAGEEWMKIYQNVTTSYLRMICFLYFLCKHILLLVGWLVVKEKWLILNTQMCIMANSIYIHMYRWVFIYIHVHIYMHNQKGICLYFSSGTFIVSYTSLILIFMSFISNNRIHSEFKNHLNTCNACFWFILSCHSFSSSSSELKVKHTFTVSMIFNDCLQRYSYTRCCSL